MSNSPTKKPLWPQTPEGTTDWDVVFEDPSNGLIATVSKSPNPEILKQTTTLVIKKLFTRDDDETEVTRFCRELDQIISRVEKDDQLSATIDAVAGLLRIIKEERKEKVRQYLQNKKKGIKSGERRTRRKKNTLSAKLFRGLLAASEPKIAISIILVLIAVVVGAVTYFATPDKKMRPRQVAATEKPAAAPAQFPARISNQAPGTEPQESKTVKTEVKKADAEPEEKGGSKTLSKWPRAVLLRPMTWPMMQVNKKERPVSYATLIYVDDISGVSAICKNYPSVQEKVLLAFSSMGLAGHQPNIAQQKKIAATATRSINKRFGTIVANVEIVRYGQEGYKVATTPLCRLER